jgi:hypothetical protein
MLLLTFLDVYRLDFNVVMRRAVRNKIVGLTKQNVSGRRRQAVSDWELEVIARSNPSHGAVFELSLKASFGIS